MTCTPEALTPATIGCISNDKDNKDDDNNNNIKKQLLVLLARQQLCHASPFLVYFFDVKPPYINIWQCFMEDMNVHQ